MRIALGLPMKLRAFVLWSLFVPTVHAAISSTDLADLSLEELSNLRVTSTALRPEKYSDAPASVYVITRDEILRSGARSLPEALRLAPNLEVAQVSATTWAISARGFLNVITNKLLVLQDGRTLYTSVLSGVLWDAQDIMLENVDRIEVISGPGAALYGANAFVGVINVITRSAADTQGVTVTAGGGRLSRDVAARVGVPLGDNAAYRLYGMHTDRTGLRPEASGVPDDMSKTTAGFRFDYANAADQARVQGDAYDAKITGSHAPNVRLKGANLVASSARELGADSRLSVRTYYDYAERNDPAAFVDRLGTFDIEGQYDLMPFRSHRVSVGLGYRHARDRTETTPNVAFIPADRSLVWRSAFAQDEYSFNEQLSLTAGVRAQSGVYGSGDVLPDLRLSWKPDLRQLAWVSASGVARTPGRIDREFFFPGHAPYLIVGGPNFGSERGEVYEVGYRATPTSRMMISATVFRQQLSRLRGGSFSPELGAFVISNEIEGSTVGLETWATVDVTDRWRLMAGLLEINQNLHPRPGSTDAGGPAALGNDPRHTVKFRSSFKPMDRVDVDLDWRYVSALSYLSTVPGYSSTDLRVAWRPRPWLEFSIEGYDVFNSGHVEFDEHGFPARIPRSAYAEVRLQF